MEVIPYQTKSRKVPGTSRTEVYRNALNIFSEVKRKSKRRPYVRSAYFKKEKIFFDYFWDHLRQKPYKDRLERLKYFCASVELVKNSRNKPFIKNNPNKPKETFYRFAGLTEEGLLFFVQIKEDSKTKRKFFMSCFPPS
ncbi:MAG: hypothetical protein WCV59_04315 [Parcubacteria group bacterium]|jgi:hypothetical protein